MIALRPDTAAAVCAAFPEILRLVLKYGGIISNDDGCELNQAQQNEH